MAEITKVNGNTVAPSEQIGRDVVWVGISCSNAVLNTAVSGGSITNLDLVRQVVDSASSITLIGAVSTNTNAGGDVMFMVEGIGFGGPGSGAQTFGEVGAGTIGDAAQIAAIKAAVEAVNGGALGTATVTFETLDGIEFI